VNYDSELLDITDVRPGAALPEGEVIVEWEILSSGQLGVTVLCDTPLAAGTVDLVSLVATVPEAAAIGEAQFIELTDILINGGLIEGDSDAGIHVSASLGDTDGDGQYTEQDAENILNMTVGTATGFDAFVLIDPLLLADISGNGTLSALDAAYVLQKVEGLNSGLIPLLPGEYDGKGNSGDDDSDSGTGSEIPPEVTPVYVAHRRSPSERFRPSDLALDSHMTWRVLSTSSVKELYSGLRPLRSYGRFMSTIKRHDLFDIRSLLLISRLP